MQNLPKIFPKLELRHGERETFVTSYKLNGGRQSTYLPTICFSVYANNFQNIGWGEAEGISDQACSVTPGVDILTISLSLSFAFTLTFGCS